jgi:hypothetical protein
MMFLGVGVCFCDAVLVGIGNVKNVLATFK